MGWCKGTCARKTMFVYMFYTMVLAPIRSFSLFFSLQFSRLSWSRRSQGTHFHQVIGICDAAAASDPQCFSMGSIFFIKKTICFTAGSEHLQPSSKICFGKLPENDGPMWENTIFTLEPLLIMNVGYIWFLSPSWFYKRIIYNNAPTRNIQTQCWDIPILTISYRVTPQWGQYIRTYIIINIYYVLFANMISPIIYHTYVNVNIYIYIYPHSARLHRIIYPVPLDSTFTDVCKWWEATAIAGLNCRPSESRQNL